jgi:hypothetical protein
VTRRKARPKGGFCFGETPGAKSSDRTFGSAFRHATTAHFPRQNTASARLPPGDQNRFR